MKNSTNTQKIGPAFTPPPPPNLLTYKQLCIGAILLGAGVISSIGAIAAPIAIETVTVGNAGNDADTRYGSDYGSVNYEYQIGKYAVTTTEYVAFLNAVATENDTYGLYNASMADTSTNCFGCGIERSSNGSGGFTYSIKDGYENFPVNYVSFWDAARFCNWMTSGSTETGMYELGDKLNPTNNIVARNAAAWNNGGVAIASEDEWYKAAYYDPTKNDNAGGYWTYPTRSDSPPDNEDANYDNWDGGLVAVDHFDGKINAASYYDTYQQGGNVWEWNDTVIFGSARGVRGGAFGNDGDILAASACSGNDPSNEDLDLGFRVASMTPIVVPEPQTYALFGGIFLSGVIFLRRRK